MKTLQDIFNSDYDKRLLTDGVLKDTFGDLFTEYEFAENFLRNADDQDHAQKAGITSVEKIGHVSGFDTPLSVFEITLAPSVRIKYSRVKIQQFLRSVLYGESAFLIFHYENVKDNDWRFSFLHVERGNTTAAKRFTYLLGKAHKARTVAERFEKLKIKILEQRHSVINDQVLFDEFSVEALSDEFFNKYKTLYANFIQYITGKRVVKTGSKWEEKTIHDPNATLYAAFGNDDKRIRDYVKKLMGRITFLYFVQEKGWFDNDTNYLQKLFENSTPKYQDDFLDCVLEPFFYTVLNTEKPNRKKAFADHNNNLRPSEVRWDDSLLEKWEKIPFLNGGLFERDENDILRTKFPPQFFKNTNGYEENFVDKPPTKDGYTWEMIPGIFDLFSQYNFTIDENDPEDAEVGIDPEMLGKIFENLLEDNKDKGAYYTPKEIVQYMCRESLIAYLQTDATDEAHKQRLRDFVSKHDATILQNPEYVRKKIKNIKICDPAIGSGAFHMGMLNELVLCTEALDNYIDKKVNRAEIKKHIIQNSIYGVDIERGAVDIARLRFWLSLVIDEDKAVPLPNLDYKIMQGNSLLEQYEGIDLSKLQDKQFAVKMVEPQRDLFGRITEKQTKIDYYRADTAIDLHDDLKSYFYETDHSKKAILKKRITEHVTDHILYNVHERKNNALNKISDAESKIKDCESRISEQKERFKGKTLPKNFASDLESQIVKCNKIIMEEKQNVAKYDSVFEELKTLDFTANEKFFLWHTWFDDVFKQGGFDIIIGNPPYVSAPTQLANTKLEQQRNCIISSRQYQSLYQKWDLYIPFIELGTQFIKSKGITTMIVPYPLTNQLYAKELRRIIINNYDMTQIVDLNGTKIFENATVSNCIPFISKQPSSGKSWICNIDDNKIIHHSFLQQHCDLVQDEKNFVWNLTQEKRDTNRHSDMHVLGDFCYVSYGLRPNSDEKTAKGEFKKEDLINDTPDNIPRRKYIEAKDIEKYKINRVRFLEYGTDRSPAKLVRPTFNEWFEPSKLFFNRLGDLVGTIDYNNHYLHNDSIIGAALWIDLHGVENKSITSSIKKFSTMTRAEMEELSKTVDLRYLLGIMNSKYAGVLLSNLRGGNYHIYPEHIRNIPIPTATPEQQAQIIAKVDDILAAKRNNPDADTSELEGEIDKLVYDLYGL